MKENEVIMKEEDYSTRYEGFDPKSPESYIIFTLTQNLYLKQSTELASFVQNQLTEGLNRNNRGVQQAGFWVLWSTSMPSILIETGFITSPTEEKYLNSEEGQNNLATAIFNACKKYIDEIDSKSNVSTINVDSVRKAQGFSDSQVYFTVQVKSSNTKIETRTGNFGGLKEIYEIRADNRYHYTAGKYLNYDDAVKYRKQIASIYPDAFVIAVKQNKIIPLHQALEQKRKKPGA